MNGTVAISIDDYNEMVCTSIEGATAQAELHRLKELLTEKVYQAFGNALTSDCPVYRYTAISTDELCEIVGLDFQQLVGEFEEQYEELEKQRRENEANAYTE